MRKTTPEHRAQEQTMATDKTFTEISKFLSYVLRHRPEEIGLVLDTEGWADISALIAGAVQTGRSLDSDLIRQIVAISDKKRFAISDDGLRIRAVQGHSTESVAIDYPEKVPPEFLYHGTSLQSLPGIRSQGLVPGERHFVHLSQDENTALSVGQRYGKPVLITVKSLVMHDQGFVFFQAENSVWLTKHVPVAFLGLPI